MILSRGLTLHPEELQLPMPASVAVPAAASLAEVALPLAPLVPREAESPAPSLHASKRLAEFQCVLETLKRFKGHRTRTAEALGMTTRALRYKLAAMRDQGIDIDQLVCI